MINIDVGFLEEKSSIKEFLKGIGWDIEHIGKKEYDKVHKLAVYTLRIRKKYFHKNMNMLQTGEVFIQYFPKSKNHGNKPMLKISSTPFNLEISENGIFPYTDREDVC